MWSQDLRTLLLTSSVPLLLVVATEVLKSAGMASAAGSRKFLHTVTGLAFMCTWPLYSSDPTARYFAAALPGMMTVRFLLAGLGITSEPRLVAGTARTGNRRELLGGPTLYGVSHVVLTVMFWRNHPAGAAGIASLCAGDGFAEVVGRRWGAKGPLAGTLPYNRQKTWMGSIGCFIAAAAVGFAYSCWFNSLGYFQRQLSLQEIARLGVVSSLAATVSETLPGPDNVTVPLAAALAAWPWSS